MQEKMFSWLDLERTCIKWVNAVFQIMFESMIVKVAQAQPSSCEQFHT